MNRFASEQQVFHVTTPDRAERCLAEGLIPRKTSQASQKSVETDIKYDTMRPAHILELGITRTESVFAHPDIEYAVDRKNGGWLNRVGAEVEVLAVTIPDPSRVYVADGLLNVEPFSAEQYWASLTTLDSYNAQEKPTFLAPPHAGSQRLTRYIYWWPEVLLPGIVKPELISRIE